MLENVKLKLIQKLMLKLMQMLNFSMLLLPMWGIQDQLHTISSPHSAKLTQKGNARKFLYRALARLLCHTAYLSQYVWLFRAHTAPQ
jgi:hypothetical protein